MPAGEANDGSTAAVEGEVRDEADEGREGAGDEGGREAQADAEAANEEDSAVDRGTLDGHAQRLEHGAHGRGDGKASRRPVFEAGDLPSVVLTRGLPGACAGRAGARSGGRRGLFEEHARLGVFDAHLVNQRREAAREGRGIARLHPVE